ncbi:MAG TPA: hypothetical protein VGG81_10630 [Edaphobacter sp.]
MEEVKRFFLASGLFCISSIAFSQVVCVGTAEQCRESQKTICANEKAEANLDLAGAKHLQGVIKDPTGPLSSSGNYEVQLRDAASGRALQRTSLDSGGRFTFTNLNGGKFRLIVVRLVAGVAQRTGFDQPSKLRCENAEDCKLFIVLRLGTTDQPVDLCPPK